MAVCGALSIPTKTQPVCARFCSPPLSEGPYFKIFNNFFLSLVIFFQNLTHFHRLRSPRRMTFSSLAAVSRTEHLTEGGTPEIDCILKSLQIRQKKYANLSKLSKYRSIFSDGNVHWDFICLKSTQHLAVSRISRKTID